MDSVREASQHRHNSPANQYSGDPDPRYDLVQQQRAVDNSPATLPVRPVVAIKTNADHGRSGRAESLVKAGCAFVRIESR